jgi:hypothetical protein
MLSQDIPPSDLVDQDEEETWDTVGAAVERSVSPPPTTREVVPGSAQQGAGADNSQMSAEERRPNPSLGMVTVAGGGPRGRPGNCGSWDCGYRQYSGCPDRDCCPVDLVSFVELPSSRVGYQSCMTD